MKLNTLALDLPNFEKMAGNVAVVQEYVKSLSDLYGRQALYIVLCFVRLCFALVETTDL